MRGVSKRFTNFAAIAAVIVVSIVQPAFGAAKTSDKTNYFESLVRKIIRALDTIDVRLPPG
ncbi:MAG: hypothetical protein QOF63_1377 [Thermoanaerobaculia bacterium]|jgi:hypothetical protein|nr:hypothetical protein [Thermoanaerobaculia bacterium]MEA2416462.1 hypothetical protein [Thermoanaerobaculia bacterium]